MKNLYRTYFVIQLKGNEFVAPFYKFTGGGDMRLSTLEEATKYANKRDAQRGLDKFHLFMMYKDAKVVTVSIYLS